MAVVYTEQWQPISNAETAIGAPMTVRQARDMATSINNDKAHVHVPSLGCGPVMLSTGVEYEVEKWVHSFAPAYCPRGYTNICFVVGHERITGAGNVDWKAYVTREPYLGSSNVTAAQLPTPYYEVSWTTSSDDHNIAVCTTNGIPRIGRDEVYVMITATSGASTQARITTFDRWPILETA